MLTVLARPLLRSIIPTTRHLATMSTQPELIAAIAAQGNIIRTLKAAKGDPAEVTAEVAKLSALKTELSALTGAPDGGKGKEKKATKYVLKTPKGTKDYHPTEMALRQTIFRKITDVFEVHGGVTIDTPVFELKEILGGKYGEDSKLIYDLKDQGGEICSLRYDLTVPFARFMAMHGSQYPTLKRYHIAKVYRRDQPAMSKGRMREFYQCDFDIAGPADAMLPDAEILAIACEVLTSLEIGQFTIKINHRKILDGVFAVCGVPEDKIRTISSAVDKMDKMAWADVRKEMVQDKGLDGAVADKIGEYVKLKGGAELVETLQKDAGLSANKTAVAGIADMALLFKYLDIYGVTDKISFDLSLARGLDYYTGIIYEAVTEGSAPPAPVAAAAAPVAARPAKPKKALGPDEEADIDESLVGVGSIAAGGRYDDLVGMFSGSTSAAGKIPCVGISFGVERIFSLLLAKQKEAGAEAGRGKPTQVFVMSVGDGLIEERMKVCAELWAAGIKTEFMYKVKPKAAGQFAVIDKDAIPYAVIIAPDEIKEGTVLIKAQLGKEEGQNKGEKVERKDMIAWLKERLQ